MICFSVKKKNFSFFHIHCDNELFIRHLELQRNLTCFKCRTAVIENRCNITLSCSSTYFLLCEIIFHFYHFVLSTKFSISGETTDKLYNLKNYFYHHQFEQHCYYDEEF